MSYLILSKLVFNVSGLKRNKTKPDLCGVGMPLVFTIFLSAPPLKKNWTTLCYSVKQTFCFCFVMLFIRQHYTSSKGKLMDIADCQQEAKIVKKLVPIQLGVSIFASTHVQWRCRGHSQCIYIQRLKMSFETRRRRSMKSVIIESKT